MRIMILGVLVVLFAGVAGADIDLVEVELEADQVPITLLVVPDGSGPGFAGARRDDGTFWGRSFRLRPWFLVWGGPEDPQTIPGYPAEDVWLATPEWGQACVGSGHPDGPADADGWFTWAPPMAAGGDLASGSATLLTIAGAMFQEFPLPVSFVSPDLNGDNEVLLQDIVFFTTYLGGAPGWEAADFNRDGVVDLTDIVAFVPAIGAICP